jgi:hypothetical protein
MILAGQTIDRDTLNRAYLSKTATGTQIMAGSLRLLGTIQIDGATTLASTTISSLTLTGALNAGANNITTTGTISGTFSGNGASITSLNGSNISSGTVADARLSTNVSLLASAQTITANKTFSASANLYFAGGTTYYINTAGTAKLNALTLVDNLNMSGSKVLAFDSNGVAPPSDGSAGTKIQLYGTGKYNIGIDSSTIWYDTYNFHRFYTNGGGTTRTLQAEIGVNGLNLYNNATITGSLDVQGEFKGAGYNEFPDPLLVSKDVSNWVVTRGTIAFDIQAPPTTNAVGSVKLTATSDDSYYHYNTYFNVNPNDWITFSAYTYCTTAGNTGDIFIRWYDATKTIIATAPATTFNAPTSWTRFSVTAQAPSNASYFQVRVDNNTTGAVMYYSAFQVERGRTMTAFKPYSGGSSASFFPSGIKLGSGGEIHSGYNNAFILKDHNNGNVTLSAAGGDLYLGYSNTGVIRLYDTLTGSDGSTKIADTAAKLYYQGNDTDGRYLTKAADSVVTSRIRMEGATAQLFVANQFNTGSNPAIDLAIGDSDTGFNWVSDGILDFYADNVVVAEMGKAGKWDFKFAPTLNGTKIWHEGNDGAGSGLDADVLDGMAPATANTASTIVQRDSSGNFSAGTITASLNGTATNISNTGTVTLATATESNAITITQPSYSTDKPVKLLNFNWYSDVWSIGNIRSGSTPSNGLGVFLNSVEKFRFIDGTLKVGTNAVWHAGNVGAGSGLDADKVDGKHSSDLMSSTVYREKIIVPAGGYAAQTAVTIPNARVYVLGSNRLQVFRDGILQEPTDDYVETSTSSVTFQYALPEDTRITFIINNAG